VFRLFILSSRCAVAVSPIIDAIEGCTATASPRAVWNCTTAGNSLIRLKGSNFGSSQAVVLVGTSVCASVVHDPVRPHREITCLTPSGTGIDRYDLRCCIFLFFFCSIRLLLTLIPSDRPVLLLQAGGNIGSNVSLSYAECPVG
jgi:hypothetical protein